MVTRQNFSIIGTGRHTPSHLVTAEEIDARIGAEHGWTREHVGVEDRYECRPPESMLTMGAEAIRIAMEQAHIGWQEVDLLIDCSTSRYRPIPCNAAHYLNHFGKATNRVACFDIQSTCLGFLVALVNANALLATGNYRHIIVVASECAMQAINWQQPESAALIGDGAAAVVLKPSPPHGSLLFAHETYAEHLDLCKIHGGAHCLPPYEYSSQRRADYQFDMNGPAVFKVALGRLPGMVRPLISKWLTSAEQDGHSAKDIHVIPHQASPRALDAVRKLLGTEPDHFHSGIRNTGNMAAASLPFMLDWCLKSNKVPERTPCMLLGTSAGYAQASMIFNLGAAVC